MQLRAPLPHIALQRSSGCPYSVAAWVILAAMTQRVGLITGSSRGLGRHIASRLARDGFSVAVNGLHDDAQAEETVREIRAGGGVAEAFAADVTEESATAELVHAVERALGPVDVLVVNATGPQPEAPFEQVTWEDHLAQLEFFVKSSVLLGRAVIPVMRERAWGRIVEIDSEVVDVPPPGRSAYVTAKSAQVGLMRSWARELAPLGITVNAVAPGFIPVERHVDVRPEALSAYLSSVPAGHMGVPEDVAHAVSFFASDGAGFITGQRVVVDGGRGLGP
jgi:3-oxoacyl-[acyl-carrier protein] reductase